MPSPCLFPPGFFITTFAHHQTFTTMKHACLSSSLLLASTKVETGLFNSRSASPLYRPHFDHLDPPQLTRIQPRVQRLFHRFCTALALAKSTIDASAPSKTGVISRTSSERLHRAESANKFIVNGVSELAWRFENGPSGR